ncbi:hypothetical protein Xcc1_22730 [Xanthomonas campestris pv. campestris]|nr:hypothetical protein Xcc1_22730 [Xanthomonas campestris pv. campestris]
MGAVSQGGIHTNANGVPKPRRLSGAGAGRASVAGLSVIRGRNFLCASEAGTYC